MNSEVNKKIDAFFSKYPTMEFKKGSIIIQACNEPLGIYYLNSGVVRSYLVSSGGTEITQNMFKAHSFLPMSWAVSGIKNNSYFAAMTDVSAKRAPKDVVLTFLKNEPDILFDLLRRIYIGMEGLWLHFESIVAGNSETKLIASLFILAKRFGKKEKEKVVVELKMSEHDVASYAGMSRETASRELQKLKKNNLVNFQKGIIVIKDIRKLEAKLLL